MQVPDNFTTGLLIESAADGKVAVGFVKDGALLGDLTLSPLDIANMAAGMLAASKDGSHNLPQKVDGAQSTGAIVIPSSFSLAPGATPDQEGLILSFGESHLIFSMPFESMRSLGEGMLTLVSRKHPR